MGQYEPGESPADPSEFTSPTFPRSISVHAVKGVKDLVEQRLPWVGTVS